MFSKARLERYADVLLWGLTKARKAPFKKGDIVLVRCHVAALPLAEVLHRRLLELGRHPLMRVQATATMELDRYRIGSDKQITFEPPGEKPLYRQLNGSIFLNAPESVTHLRHAPPDRIAKGALAAKPLRDILVGRETKGQFSWTLCVYPTAALAKQAQMPLPQYARQVAKACYLHRKAPLEHWERIFKSVSRIKRWLHRLPIARLRVESKTTDLEITLGDQRCWVGISGRNIPSFEIYTSPDWRGTRGTYTADQRSYRNGNIVAGVRLEFEKGRVVQAQAQTGQKFLRHQLAMDAGAVQIGEFSLTDRRFSKIDCFMANTLFDENFGGRQGNCHIALGSSYANTYAGAARGFTKARQKRLGFNQSALHWDLVNTEKKRVTARLKGGKTATIYENGQFTGDI